MEIFSEITVLTGFLAKHGMKLDSYHTMNICYIPILIRRRQMVNLCYAPAACQTAQWDSLTYMQQRKWKREGQKSLITVTIKLEV